MNNPFKYGGIVGSDAFCNRRQELVDVRLAMENGDNLFIYSERRLGKTSLVQKALSELPKTIRNGWPLSAGMTGRFHRNTQN